MQHRPSYVSEVPPIVHEVLRSPGQPLDTDTRTLMEPRFGHDFSHVRVHVDVRAAESADAVKALAYTVGRDVVFSGGQYAPKTYAGQRLLAHELAHVVQQNKASGALLFKRDNASSYGALEEDAAQAAERLVAQRGSEADRGGVTLAGRAIPRLTSDLRLQRQPCNKADDKIITGPLKSQLPDVKCAPNGETLGTVRAVPGVPQNILGVTSVADSALAIRFEGLPTSKCRAIIESAYELRLGPFMYIKAGKYADGIEQIPDGRPCPAGKNIPKTLLVTPPMAAKLKEGEIEHCEDHKLAFALSQGKYNQAMKDLAAEDYCPGGPPSAKGPDCQGEFMKRFKDRTGIDFSDQSTVAQCLHAKSRLRDSNHWHDVKESTFDVAYAADCKSVTYIPDPDGVPEISLEKHPSSSIIQGCREK